LIDEAGNLVGELKRVPGVGKEFNYYFTDYNGANGVTHAFVGVLHQQTTPAAHTEVYVTLNTREAVQRDFLRYTSQQILKVLCNEQSPVQEDLVVNAKDRKRQVWERNSLSILLWSSKVLAEDRLYISESD
jgi:hypothetical protein